MVGLQEKEMPKELQKVRIKLKWPKISLSELNQFPPAYRVAVAGSKIRCRVKPSSTSV